MKKIILIGTFITSLFLASCNKENIPNNGSITGKKITVSANINKEAQTRMNYSDDDTLFRMDWSANESFIVYNGSNSEGQEFNKTVDNKFEGTAPTGTGKYYAVYGCADTSNTNGVLIVDIANQKGDTTENGIRSFMVAESDNLDSTTSFKFNHKLTLLKLNLTFPGGVTGKVEKVIISNMHNKASYNLSDSTYSYARENKGYIVATNNSSGFEITDKKITVYVAVFPEIVFANSVTISAVIGTDEYFYKMTKEKELKEGKVVPVNVKLKEMEENFRDEYTNINHYMWDAYLPYRNIPSGTWGDDSSWHNTTNDSASASCKDCPTAQQMVAYLKAGVYWDDVTVGQKTYKLNGFEYHNGLWLKKRRYIKNFYSETETDVVYNPDENPDIFMKLSDLSEDKVQDIRTSGEYFFLPACGYYFEGGFNKGGEFGLYWLSTYYKTIDSASAGSAYCLCFRNEDVRVTHYYRRNGYIPLALQ